GLLDELAGELLHLGHEATAQVDRMAHWNAFLLAQAQVVDAVSRRRVHNAGALFDGDEVGRDHEPGTLLGRQVRVEGLIVEVDKIRPLQALDYLVLAVQDLQPGLGEDQEFVSLSDLDVVDVLVDGEGYIAWQCPGCGGPGEDAGLWVTLQPEPDVDAGVGRV